MHNTQRQSIQPGRIRVDDPADTRGCLSSRHAPAHDVRASTEASRASIAAGRMPDAHRVMPVATDEPWEATAIDITRLDKTNPSDRRRINNAWRALKAAAPAEAANLGATFAALREHFPDAGIEVPAETLNEPIQDGETNR